MSSKKLNPVKITCIRHPKYTGQSTPELSCKVCCARYIAVVTEAESQRRRDRERMTHEFLAKKEAMRSGPQAGYPNAEPKRSTEDQERSLAIDVPVITGNALSVGRTDD